MTAAADQAPDPARPDAVQVPQVVAFAARHPDGSLASAWAYRAQAEPTARSIRGDVVPLVTEPDALAYAEALAGQRVREERAAVLAQVDEVVAAYIDSAGAQAGISGDLDQWAGERGDHLDPS